jgi:Fe-S-cluster containining protein
MNGKGSIKAKFKRLLTSFMPISYNRNGTCISCGACCNLPYRCIFLRYQSDGRSFCAIYPIRPMNCRKYPRTLSEFLTADTCGYRFENNGSGKFHIKYGEE